jgi:hypothetical protein
MATVEELQVEPSCRKEIERLLSELQQLLIGISIMQVRVRAGATLPHTS